MERAVRTITVHTVFDLLDIPVQAMRAMWQWTLAIALLVAVLAILAYVFFGRDSHLEAVEVDDVPDGLSALQVGMAVDGIVSGEDLGAQLFDWAVRGNVRLSLASGQWTLIQGERPDEDAYPYEREAWDRLFHAGKRRQVKPEEHHGDILAATLILQKGAEDCFATGKRRMADGRSATIAMAVWLMGAGCLLLAAVMAGRQRGLNAYGIAPLAIGAVIPVVVAAWMSGWLQRYYPVRSRRRNGLVAAAILLCDAVMGVLTVNMLASPIYLAEQAAPMTAAGMIAALIAPFVGRRSRYGHQLLCQLMGFRDALADPDRFPGRRPGESKEAYFFRMLPYAQALGVGDALVAQYAALDMPCPDWLDWQEEAPFTAAALQRSLVQIRDQILEQKPEEAE